ATHKVMVTINYGPYREQEEFYVCNLLNWDVILGDPALVKHRAIITMETGRTTLMPKNVKQFELKPWKFQVAEQKKVKITTAATDLTKTFNPIAEFPKVFPKEKDVSLPPLREINHDNVPSDPNFRDIPRNIKPKEAFMQRFKEKLEAEEKTGRCYRSNNPSCCQMMVIAKTS